MKPFVNRLDEVAEQANLPKPSVTIDFVREAGARILHMHIKARFPLSTDAVISPKSKRLIKPAKSDLRIFMDGVQIVEDGDNWEELMIERFREWVAALKAELESAKVGSPSAT